MIHTKYNYLTTYRLWVAYKANYKQICIANRLGDCDFIFLSSCKSRFIEKTDECWILITKT